ncbi:Copia protein [Linum perenne]
MKELKMSGPSPIRIYCDNKSAIAMAHNHVSHDKTKHVEVNRHFIKEKLDNGTICIPYISTTEQAADILTKSLPKGQFDYLKSKLALKDIFEPA